VTVRRPGGEPNQECALALAQALAQGPGWPGPPGSRPTTGQNRWRGRGGPQDPAGAIFDATTLARGRQLGLDPAVFLHDNNSTEFFAKLGDLLIPGPTHTNVNDFRAILIDSP